MKKSLHYLIISLLLLPASCRLFYGHETSSVTEWDYNQNYIPETPPGMVLIQGCAAYRSGNYCPVFPFKTEDTTIKNVKIFHYYISVYEETNFQYQSYLRYLKMHHKTKDYQMALPDSTIWQNEMLTDEEKAYLEKNYFNSDEFKDYPILGITRRQAQKYAKWKTERYNEMKLIAAGFLSYDSIRDFSVHEYLYGKDTVLFDLYTDSDGKRKPYGDGTISSDYRLPTLIEWEYAAWAMGNSENKYLVTEKPLKQKKMDPGNHFSYLYLNKSKPKSTPLKEKLGKMGLTSVYEGKKNNYGIYNLNENVSELIYPIMDSTEFIRLGGSWKLPDKNYEAEYKKGHMDSLNYIISSDFTLYKDTIDIPYAFTGIRLAMDFIGHLNDSNVKRRKGTKDNK